jgi:hypothetical protein
VQSNIEGYKISGHVKCSPKFDLKARELLERRVDILISTKAKNKYHGTVILSLKINAVV